MRSGDVGTRLSVLEKYVAISASNSGTFCTIEKARQSHGSPRYQTWCMRVSLPQVIDKFQINV